MRKFNLITEIVFSAFIFIVLLVPFLFLNLWVYSFIFEYLGLDLPDSEYDHGYHWLFRPLIFFSTIISACIAIVFINKKLFGSKIE